MSSVSYPTLASGAVISASELNSNFSDVVSMVSSVGNDQLAGGITSDKLADRYTITYDTICVIPPVFTKDTGTGTDTVEGTNEVLIGDNGADAPDVMQWQPIMRDGMEAYLCSINVYSKSSTDNPVIRFYLNGSVSAGTGALIAGTGITLGDDSFQTLAQSDPISQPLITMTNGDYITINLYANTSASAAVRGVYVTFCMKYALQA